MTQLSLFEQAKANGCTDRLAEMLAARKAPGANTDREFLREHTNGPDANFLRAMAQKHYGFKPGPNDVYVPQLCRPGKPFDPQAWVPPGNARSHIEKVCKENGYGCSGSVNVVKTADSSPPPPIPLAESIVQEEVAKLVKENPDKARCPKEELRHEVIKKHGPQP